jgi:hypothetical protein
MIPIAFDENTTNLLNKNKISWNKMIDRSIISKVEHIFLALKWDLSLIKEIKIKKPKKTKAEVALKIIKDQEETIKSQPTFTEDDFIEEKECSPETEQSEKVNIKPY